MTRRTGVRGRPGRGRARRRHRPRAGRRRSCSAPRRRLRRAGPVRARPRGARARLLPRRAQALARMGVMLSRGAARCVAARDCGGTYASARRRGGCWQPGAEGLLFAPYLAGERTPHADPGARGAFAGLSPPPRPRRAGSRGARGRGLRPARRLDLRRGARRARPRVGRVSGGGARAQLWLRDRGLGARDAAGGDGRRRGRGVRRRAARRRGAGVWATRTEAVGACRSRRESSRAGVDRALRRGARALPRAYPALRPLQA